MDKHQLRALTRKVLRHLEPEIPYSEEAVELLMLTAAQESKLGEYIKQLGKGPARGIFQMEPATERDLIAWIQQKRIDLWFKLKLMNVPGDDDSPEGDQDMIFNLAWQIAMARTNYHRKPGRIPTDAGEQARYYKKWWNTEAGAATPEEAMAAYRKYALPVRQAI